MNKATYDRVITEVEKQTRGMQGDKAFFQKDILYIVSTSLKMAIAEELLNRNCSK